MAIHNNLIVIDTHHIEPVEDKISRLHGEIVGHLKQSLISAIQIGQLLTEQKQKLKHGEFGKWIKTNLPFTNRTARNYVRLYLERDRLKTETVSDLKSAYRLLNQPKVIEKKQVQEEEDDSWWKNATPDELRGAIDVYNDDLGDPEWFMDRDAKWVFDMLSKDGSMDPNNEEHLATALKIEILKHRCYAFNTAWHLGMAELPESWRRVLIEDGEVPTSEPHRTCKDDCWILEKAATRKANQP